MEQKFCQSCGMPLTDNDKGINADGSRNDDYCNYCYMNGRFTQDFTMEQMIEHCARFTDDINKMRIHLSSHKSRYYVSAWRYTN